MPQNAFLLITHGTSDLQILMRGETGRIWRAMPDKSLVRRLHVWLLERSEDIEVVSLGDLSTCEHEASITDFSEETFALWTNQDSPEAYPLRSNSGKLQVVLPKIQPAVDRWLTEYTDDATECPIQRTLVLSTDRGGQEAQEPIASFTFIQRWLAAKGVEDVQECIYLHPGEKLEDSNGPISPKAAERIEQAVRDFWHNKSQRTLLLFAHIGGMPQIKPLLKELSLLLAGECARNLFKTEHSEVGLVQYDPIDAVRTRRQCLQLVRRGALLEAYGMAAPYHTERDAQRWVRPMEQAAQLLNGNPIHEKASFPALEHILNVANKAQCLLVAIRVETALLNGRWLEAISGSVVFLEAAFHDAINQWAKINLKEYQPRRRRMEFHESPPQTLIEAGALKKWTGKDSGPNVYLAEMMGREQLKAWDDVLNKEFISQLRDVVYAKNSGEPLINYRHFNTHGVLTQYDIDEAIKRFMGANLWSQQVDNKDPTKRPKPGKCFLGRRLVSDVVREISGLEEDPAMLYQDLLLAIETRLIDPANDFTP